MSTGADHWALIYLAEAQQYVNLHGVGGRPSLLADAAGNDVLAYDDPLRTLVGLRNLLKQQHVAGRGAEVAKMHARARYLLEEAERGRAVLEREIRQVESRVAELEAKALRPEKWKEALDEYAEGAKNSSIAPNNPVARLLRQVKAGKDRGHKVYVAISDGTSMRSRERLLKYLREGTRGGQRFVAGSGQVHVRERIAEGARHVPRCSRDHDALARARR